MLENYLDGVRKAGSSVGAVIEIVAEGVPPGLGAPVYGKLDADLAGALMGINAVKGVEIGDGFATAALSGEDNADEIRMGNDGAPRFLSNHAGGILGGISTGQPIVARFAVKPTSSILSPRKTVDRYGNETEITTKGRHDPCVGIRAVPVGEAMVACVIADHYLRHRAQVGEPVAWPFAKPAVAGSVAMSLPAGEGGPSGAEGRVGSPVQIVPTPAQCFALRRPSPPGRDESRRWRPFPPAGEGGEHEVRAGWGVGQLSPHPAQLRSATLPGRGSRRRREQVRRRNSRMREPQSNIEQVITAFAAGEMVIVVDDDDRENEGDLLLAASHATPEKMAFIIRNTCGIVCAPLTAETARRLRLAPMVADNDAPHGTAFTVSVDYRHGTTTGISADDRTLTVRNLANNNTAPPTSCAPATSSR